MYETTENRTIHSKNTWEKQGRAHTNTTEEVLFNKMLSFQVNTGK